MEYSRKVKTRSCHKREVLVVTRHPDHAWALAGRSILEHERVEIFPEVFITFTDASKQGWLKVLIEAKRDVKILDGYPYQHQQTGAGSPGIE